MAEKLSIAGLVAGLVSLGIQATTGIASYLDAIHSRQDEVASAKSYMDSVIGNIQAMEKIHPRLQNLVDLFSDVEAYLKSCHDEVTSLQSLIEGLSTPATPSRIVQERLNEKKSNLPLLDDKLSRFNDSLQSAI
ncbi:hypothetical protein PG993_004858 [Apiospora rasikravindrae]|uniref:Fungal N-terminal domain-containing protein n=1 Tax=Apiospora rasikravindrae TaxID=990691 RepID=A0ABR1TE02_9PEZI